MSEEIQNPYLTMYVILILLIKYILQERSVNIRTYARAYSWNLGKIYFLFPENILSLNRMTDTSFAFIGVFVLVFSSSFIILSMDSDEYYGEKTNERSSSPAILQGNPLPRVTLALSTL